jgi:hypothetical protein
VFKNNCTACGINLGPWWVVIGFKPFCVVCNNCGHIVKANEDYTVRDMRPSEKLQLQRHHKAEQIKIHQQQVVKGMIG